MALHFVSRTLYRNKKQALASVIIDDKTLMLFQRGDQCVGGNGCAEILTSADKEFDTIAVAVGTGVPWRV